uniref:Mitochondrial cardiolipin hydrolase n=1 Tax=Palpitomonas bilix TaxID=652834 RepID=A0A7S3LXA3_9EUKA|mmetsp:Transcript_7382/g.19150  ORF Transcript_7382/g.19150 Transcript_7382/m.19150 type:complete len:175 (+) Transcript_7382:167-691(+)|eukprot:CAMPEP_0113869944 /NCGR_PEP_ID=MMETSP0780_2-20120614/1812_1 /TAXON_ID=652834 /ORGANISM="Palpitomonas bilix" /LENGTH=174 /DNA_ID=CAMNT_0000855167 /DNA_START=95 /DNA_END=619 /DNA_ORIENTATION=+ /assembly_acc=CAM_ASM_000599
MGGDATVVDCLFFPDAEFYNRPYRKRDEEHEWLTLGTTFSRFLRFLHDAKETLDICVFTITCDEIAKEIEYVHKRGVKVRIITDDDKALDRGSDIFTLAERGIEVKRDDSSFHMHNKFCVIDGVRVMTGSFNWTRSAVSSNQENVIVVDHKGTADKFTKEFEKLWSQFVPVKMD